MKGHRLFGRRPIHYAAREGHPQVVEVLLEAGADPTRGLWPNREASSPLALARDRGHDEVVRVIEEWLHQRRGTTSRGEQLGQAAAEGDIDRVRAMVEEDRDVLNETDEGGGNTALHHAARNGDQDLARLLVEAGIEVDRRNHEGEKELHRALFRSNRPLRDQPGDVAIARLLIEHGAEVDIWVVSALGDAETVERMLKENAELANFRCGRVNNKNASTYPLGVAAREGHIEVVKLLLDHGADPDGKCHRQGALIHVAGPLAYAIERGHFEVANLLIDRGAAVDAPANDSELGVPDEALLSGNQDLIDRVVVGGGRPMMWTYMKAKQYCVIAELLDRAMAVREAGFLAQDRSEGVIRQAMRWGLSFGDANVVSMVLRCKPDFDSDYWFECLRWGLQSGSSDTVRLILDYGIDANIRGPERSTLLHWVGGAYDEREGRWSNDQSTMIELSQTLLSCGADLNTCDDELCSTPLGWHARYGHEEVVAFLIERGAAKNLPSDHAWATPLAWAEKRGHGEIVEMLQGNR